MKSARSKRIRRQLEALLQVWPEHPDHFRRRSAAVGYWNALLAGAEVHGLLGALQQAWRDSGFVLPPEQQKWLQRRCAVAKLLNRGMLPALAEAVRALETDGIPCLVLKGPVLGERLLGDAGLRPAVDLDILVGAEHTEQAVQALAAVGYQAETGLTATFFRQHHHHLHLYGAERPPVELHFQPSSNFAVELTSAELLGRSLPYNTSAGLACRILAPEDELLYLAIHCAGHRCARLGWLYDIKLFLRQHPNLNWTVIWERAARSGSLTALAFTLHTLHRRLSVDTTIPLHSLRFSASDLLISAIETLPESAWSTRLLGLIYEATLCDRGAAALQIVRKRLAAPRE